MPWSWYLKTLKREKRKKKKYKGSIVNCSWKVPYDDVISKTLKKVFDRLLNELGTYIVTGSNNCDGGSNDDFEPFSYEGNEWCVPINIGGNIPVDAMDSDDNMAKFSY